MANIAKSVIAKGLRQAGNMLREEAGALEVCVVTWRHRVLSTSSTVSITHAIQLYLR